MDGSTPARRTNTGILRGMLAMVVLVGMADKGATHMAVVTLAMVAEEVVAAKEEMSMADHQSD